MGATLLGVPLPLIGFNSSLGWTHTFSTDNRFTLRYLALDPANPTRYVKDGVSKPMTAVPLSIQVKGADGKLVPLTRTLYTTEWGPMIMDSSFAWSKSAAFALQDANYTNTKIIDQVILNGKATTVDGLLLAAATHTAMPWVNTMAADKNGDAMYFNYSVAANVANAQLDACVPGPESGAPFKALMASTGVVVMAGTPPPVTGAAASVPRSARPSSAATTSSMPTKATGGLRPTASSPASRRSSPPVRTPKVRCRASAPVPATPSCATAWPAPTA